MNLRLEGTQQEINVFLDKLSQSNFPDEVNKVSKFYPNKNSNWDGNGSYAPDIGRVYIELN